MPWHRPVQRHPQASAAGDSAASRRQVPRTASLRERDGDRGRRRLTGSLGEAIIAGSGCAGHAFSSSRLGGEIRRTFTVPPGGLASSPLISFSCRASSLDGSSLRAQLALCATDWLGSSLAAAPRAPALALALALAPSLFGFV